MLPKTLYRPSDNQTFHLSSDLTYHSGDPSGLGHDYDRLIDLGFRDYPFTQAEMQAEKDITFKCKIDGNESVISIPEFEWLRLMGE